MGTGADAFGGQSSPRLDEVRRIAVLRANALGDLLVAWPALDALRAAYPEAELVLLGLAWHRELLTGRPGPVDRVAVVPPVRGVSVPDDRPAPERPPPAFVAAMRRERFDLAVQLHGGGGFSNPFVRALGARVTAGLRAEGAEPLDRWVHYAYWQPEVLRYLEVAALVGAPPVTLQARVAVSGADRAEADRALGALRGPLVAVHPGAGDPRRRWPPERFASLADALVDDGATVALTGSAEERSLTCAVASLMHRPARDLAGRLSIGGLVGLLDRCSLAVGNDTGPLHLARAVGTPTVTAYWAGNLLNAGPVGRSRDRTPVAWTTACPVCGASALARACRHEVSFVAAIGVEEMLAAARDLLQPYPTVVL